MQGSAAEQEGELVEVSLGGGAAESEGEGLDNLNIPRDLQDFLFLARSSQPGSIGDELQRRGVRVFPQEAFFDSGLEREERYAPVLREEAVGGGVGEGRGGGDSNDEGMSRFRWAAGSPLPRTTPIKELPRDEEGRVRLILWDPCGEATINNS